MHTACVDEPVGFGFRDAPIEPDGPGVHVSTVCPQQQAHSISYLTGEWWWMNRSHAYEG